VLQLVTGNGHLLALVAHNRLMSAHIPMCLPVLDVKLGPTAMDAICDRFRALCLNVDFKLIKLEPLLRAAIEAFISRIGENLLSQKMDIFTKLLAAPVTGKLRRVLIPARFAG